MKVSEIYTGEADSHTAHQRIINTDRYLIFTAFILKSQWKSYKWIFTSLKLMMRHNIPGAISGDDWSERPSDQGLVPE